MASLIENGTGGLRHADADTDADVVLPFRLYIWEGEGAAARTIPLTGLAREPHRGLKPVVLTENLPAELELVAVGAGSVAAGEGVPSDADAVFVYWDELIDWDRPDDEAQAIRLTASANRHVLALAREYPWRCGRYGYRVVYRGVTYYGAFEVVSRLLREDQTASMHETINRHLEGLIVDYLKLRSVDRERSQDSELDEHRAWSFLNWYRPKSVRLLQAIKAIELSFETELKEQYVVELSERKMTPRSLRWAAGAQGARYNGQKYLNRRMQLHGDTPANRLIKFWLTQLLGQIQEASVSLRALAEQFARNCDRLSGEIERAQQQMADIQQARTVAAAYRERVGQTLHGKRLELQAASRRLSSLQSMQHDCDGFRRELREVLYAPFWRQVMDKPPSRLQMGHHVAYRQVYSIWKEAAERTRKDRQGGHRADMRAAVLKPTSLLYEYYTLFKTVEALQSLGFALDGDTLREQLLGSYEVAGLQEGTTIRLRREDRLIEITYDRMLDNHDQLAVANGSAFFSHEPNRKPDIRIDLYAVEQDDIRRYESTVIVEVKYRPLWNLYSSIGYTEAMLQLSRYYMIRHACKEQGRTVYNRNPVRDVICVYPGDPQQEPLTETGCGVFLQLFPDGDTRTVGLDVLTGRLEFWLGGGL